jgi:regulator of RNase E activity RraA
VGDEVTISGMRVRTGDLLHGDVNGILHIPDECADQVAEAAYQIWAKEEETMRRITASEASHFTGPEIKH